MKAMENVRKERADQEHLRNGIQRNSGIERACQAVGGRQQAGDDHGMQERIAFCKAKLELIVFVRCIVDKVAREGGQITRQPAHQKEERQQERTLKQALKQTGTVGAKPISVRRAGGTQETGFIALQQRPQTADCLRIDVREHRDGQQEGDGRIRNGRIGNSAVRAERTAKGGHDGEKQTERIGEALQARAEAKPFGIDKESKERREGEYGKNAVGEGKGCVRYPCGEQDGRAQSPEKIKHEKASFVLHGAAGHWLALRRER